MFCLFSFASTWEFRWPQLHMVFVKASHWISLCLCFKLKNPKNLLINGISLRNNYWTFGREFADACGREHKLCSWRGRCRVRRGSRGELLGYLRSYSYDDTTANLLHLGTHIWGFYWKKWSFATQPLCCVLFFCLGCGGGMDHVFVVHVYEQYHPVMMCILKFTSFH